MSLAHVTWLTRMLSLGCHLLICLMLLRLEYLLLLRRQESLWVKSIVRGSALLQEGKRRMYCACSGGILLVDVDLALAIFQSLATTRVRFLQKEHT